MPLKCKSSPEVMCLSRMWEHATSISATLKSILNAGASCTVCVCKPVWECVLMDIVLFFCVCVCVTVCRFVWSQNRLVDPALSDLSFRGSVFKWMLLSPSFTLTTHKKETSLSPSRMHQNIHVLISALVWKTKKKKAQVIIIVCVWVPGWQWFIAVAVSLHIPPLPPPPF